MSYAVKIGTVEAVWIDKNPTPAGHVRFDGAWPEFPIWDATINNVRARTQAEIDNIPAELRALNEAAEPDMSTLRNQATNATNTNNTFLAITTPSNAQTLAQVRALTNQNNRIIAVLLRIINKELG